MSVACRPGTPADGPALAAMGRRCFIETFGAHFPPDDLTAHLERMFGPGGLPAELANGSVRLMMAEEDDAIAGYLKLVPMTLPVDHPAGALEIKQLYVLRPWQGTGVAPALMDWAVGEGRAAGAPALFLSVWSEGARAIAFYRRRGFDFVGHAPFVLGSRTYRDPVMRLDL